MVYYSYVIIQLWVRLDLFQCVMGDFKHQEGLFLKQEVIEVLNGFQILFMGHKKTYWVSLFLSLNLQLLDSNRITE